MNCLSMTRINLNKTLGVMQSIVSPNIASPTSNCLPGWFAIRQIAAQNPNEASTQIQNDTQTETQSSSKSENVSTTSVPTTKTSSSEETGSERYVIIFQVFCNFRHLVTIFMYIASIICTTLY